MASKKKPAKRGEPRTWAEAISDHQVKDTLGKLSDAQLVRHVRAELKLRSDKQAIDVFAQNLGELLLSPPFGAKAVLGIDPGQRTGCKCAVVDATGKLLEHETVYLVQGDSALERAKATVLRLCKTHGVAAVAVGNGTHGRETEAFAREYQDDIAHVVPMISIRADPDRVPQVADRLRPILDAYQMDVFPAEPTDTAVRPTISVEVTTLRIAALIAAVVGLLVVAQAAGRQVSAIGEQHEVRPGGLRLVDDALELLDAVERRADVQIGDHRNPEAGAGSRPARKVQSMINDAQARRLEPQRPHRERAGDDCRSEQQTRP